MAKAHQRILVDHNTFNNLSQEIKVLLVPAEEMKLKGLEAPIIPYFYNSGKIPPVSAVDEVLGYNAVLRSKIKTALGEQLDKVFSKKKNRLSNSNSPIESENTTMSDKCKVFFTVIIGLPGTGKSTAAHYFKHIAKKRGISCSFLQAHPDMQSKPYSVLKLLFSDLVGVYNLETLSQTTNIIKDLIDQIYPDFDTVRKQEAQTAVETILDLSNFERSKDSYDCSDAITTRRSSTHQLKASEIVFHKLLCFLLKKITSAVIIENAHFCDELSWSGLLRLIQEKDLVLSVLLTVGSTSGTNKKSWIQNLERGELREKRAASIRKGFSPAKTSRTASFLGTIELEECNTDDPYQFDTSEKSDMNNVSLYIGKSRFGLNFQPTNSYKAIISNQNCTTIEMTGLCEEEVFNL
jgi:hypothetical protein